MLSILLLRFLAHLTSWQTSRNGREKEQRFLYQPCFVKRVNVITIAETTIGLLCATRLSRADRFWIPLFTPAKTSARGY